MKNLKIKKKFMKRYDLKLNKDLICILIYINGTNI